MSDIDQRTQDAKARTDAQCNFRQPVILQAGAGTGKTAALVARILMWCLGPGWQKNSVVTQGEKSGDDHIAARTIDRLVAITFTEKAAAEMAGRVIQGMVAICNEDEVIGFEPGELDLDASEMRQRAKALLGVIDRLRVSTIHSFCQQIVSRGALELGVHPQFEVDADKTKMLEIVNDVIGSWWRGALGSSPDPDATDLLARGVGPREISSMLLLFLENNATEEEVSEDPFSADRFEQFIVAFRSAVAEYCENVAQAIAVDIWKGRQLNGVAGMVTICDLNQILGSVQTLEELAASLEEMGFDAQLALNHLSDASVASKTIEKKHPGTLERHKKFFPVVDPFYQFLNGFDPDFLRTVGRVVAPLLGQVQHQARCAGILNFQDLLRLARDLVCDHKDAREQLQGGIDQLLLDEVQDTDPLQFEIVAALTSGVSSDDLGLFIVGDPKQSIYGWRQADLRAYEDFLEYLVARGGVRHSLSVNFRSVPAILREVSSIVRPVMIETPGLQPSFEELLVCDSKQEAPGYCAGGRRPVEHWATLSRNKIRDPDDNKRKLAHRVRGIEALAVAKDIFQIHAQGGCKWSDFGILMRATTGRDQLLDTLRAAAVPYVVEGDKSFNLRREVMDALNLVGAILDPLDPLPLLGALRSSVVGLPDAAIAGLWAAGLPHFLSVAQTWSDDRAAELSRIIGVARDITPAVDRSYSGWPETVDAFVQNVVTLRQCWRDDPADVFVRQLRHLLQFDTLESSRFLGAHRLSNLEKFFGRLLSLAMDTRGVAMMTLRGLRTPILEGHEEEEPTQGGESIDAVRVMTIHKAKGLSFKQMYLLGISSDAKRKHTVTSAVFRDSDGHLEWVMAKVMSFGCPALQDRQTKIRDAELVRLWYVALTRAEERMVTIGSSTTLDQKLKSFSDFLFSGDGVVPDLDRLIAWVEPSVEPEDDESSDSESEIEEFPEQLVALESAEELIDGVRWVAVDYENLEQDTIGERALPPLEMDTAQALKFNQKLAGERDVAEGRSARKLIGAPSKVGEKPRKKAEATAGEGLGSEVARVIGTALHLAFEVGDGEPDFAAASMFLQGTVNSKQLPKARAALAETEEALEGGELLKRFAVIAPHILGREVPMLLRADEPDDEPIAAYAGSIDMLYTDPDDGTLVVADFKTDRVPASQLAEQAEHHAQQGRIYLRSAQMAFPDAADYRFEVWFLNHDQIV